MYQTSCMCQKEEKHQQETSFLERGVFFLMKFYSFKIFLGTSFDGLSSVSRVPLFYVRNPAYYASLDRQKKIKVCFSDLNPYII